MKKVTFAIACLALLANLSCKEQKEEPTVEKTETVVIEKETEPSESDGTSISIDKDGVEFSSKSGENKTEVEIKDDKASVKSE
ncbi:hypothetical protein SY27_01875 [Flavobacterium sp. 316]|uniref:Uncharacterized protein n=1 Tax=Flavobacterium sediminilitoris TaxID=2024526 RepID=A0ABY4HJL4_9FLAO|nr:MULTISPECIES: hypothetical protein [Flavobacterium]KIX22598.1 hypothetical protein SY27_01875 [Flavobacterium sp. 316]UOX32905.1 hypothetical protein LXD69_12765 [Flavobacterium sediminilitoris]